MLATGIILCVIGICVPYAFPLIFIGLVLIFIDHRRKEPDRSIREHLKQPSLERAAVQWPPKEERDHGMFIVLVIVAISGFIFLVFLSLTTCPCTLRKRASVSGLLRYYLADFGRPITARDRDVAGTGFI